MPLPGAATYTATKHAVVGLTGAVRAELRGSGVTVSAVLPTFARTELVSGLPLRSVPTVTADEVGAAVVRLAGRRHPPGCVTVPGWLTGMGAFHAALPSWLREALAARAVRAQVAPIRRPAWATSAGWRTCSGADARPTPATLPIVQ